MLSKYFKFKTKRTNFIENAEKIKEKLNGKKLIIYGEAEGFYELNKRYNFDKTSEIVAFASSTRFGKLKKTMGIKTIGYKEIPKYKFDTILITGENSLDLVDKLEYKVYLQNFDYELLFKEEVKDEYCNMSYLLKYDIENRLKHLKSKLGGKRIVLYGGGIFLQLIQKYFDLSDFDIIGIADKKYDLIESPETICGYKLYSPSQITSLNPDYVVITTKKVISTVEDLYFKYLKYTKIKLIPIIKKSWYRTIREG